jgi:hypothetical protein
MGQADGRMPSARPRRICRRALSPLPRQTTSDDHGLADGLPSTQRHVEPVRARRRARLDRQGSRRARGLTRRLPTRGGDSGIFAPAENTSERSDHPHCGRPRPLANACGTNKEATPNHIVLITSLNNLDVSDGTEALNVGLCIGRQVTKKLQDDPCKPVLTLSIPGAQSPLPKLQPISESGPVNPRRRNAYQAVGGTVVNLAGDPRRYPFDSYIGLLQWSITIQSTAESQSRAPDEDAKTSSAKPDRAANSRQRSKATAPKDSRSAPEGATSTGPFPQERDFDDVRPQRRRGV